MRNAPQTSKKPARPASSILPEASSKHASSPSSSLDRPKSVDLSEMTMTETSIPGCSSKSQDKQELSMHGIGSSLSVDSGHPPPYSSSEFFNYGQSLDSLLEGDGGNSEMMQERTPHQAQRASSSIGFVEHRTTERYSTNLI